MRVQTVMAAVVVALMGAGSSFGALTDGIRFYSSFDSGTDADINASGVAAPVYASGTTYGAASGKFGGGITLDGTGGSGLIYQTYTDATHTVFDDAVADPTTRKWSIAYWVKGTNNFLGDRQGDVHFFVAPDNVVGDAYTSALNMRLWPSFGSMHPTYYNGGAAWVGAGVQPAPADTEWHHVVITLDGALAPPNGDRVYVDGALASTGGNDNLRQEASLLNRLILGGRLDPTGVSNQAWNIPGIAGTFDEFLIYNRTLSSTEATELFNLAGPIPEPATLCLLALGGVLVTVRQRRAA